LTTFVLSHSGHRKTTILLIICPLYHHLEKTTTELKYKVWA
jgi:hypothetical protein